MKISFDRIVLFFQLLIVISLLGLTIRVFVNLSDLASAGNIILHIGNVGIDTQELVKRGLNGDRGDWCNMKMLRAEITMLLNDLSAGNPDKKINVLDDLDYQEELSRLYMQWKKLETMIEENSVSEKNRTYLFLLSIKYQRQSKVALAAAEKYFATIAEEIRWEAKFSLTLLLLLLLTLFQQFHKKIKRTKIPGNAFLQEMLPPRQKDFQK